MKPASPILFAAVLLVSANAFAAAVELPNPEADRMDTQLAKCKVLLQNEAKLRREFDPDKMLFIPHMNKALDHLKLVFRDERPKTIHSTGNPPIQSRHADVGFFRDLYSDSLTKLDNLTNACQAAKAAPTIPNMSSFATARDQHVSANQLLDSAGMELHDKMRDAESELAQSLLYFGGFHFRTERERRQQAEFGTLTPAIRLCKAGLSQAKKWVSDSYNARHASVHAKYRAMAACKSSLPSGGTNKGQ